jgi:hypothetical protein
VVCWHDCSGAPCRVNCTYSRLGFGTVGEALALVSVHMHESVQQPLVRRTSRHHAHTEQLHEFTSGETSAR